MSRRGRNSGRNNRGNGTKRGNSQASSLNRPRSQRRTTPYGSIRSQRSGRGLNRTPSGMGSGRGNPSPFCRFYPWLPSRRGNPIYRRRPQLYQGTRENLPVSQPTPQQGMQPATPQSNPSQLPAKSLPTQKPSLNALQQQKKMLEQQLQNIKARLEQLNSM